MSQQFKKVISERKGEREEKKKSYLPAKGWSAYKKTVTVVAVFRYTDLPAGK